MIELVRCISNIRVPSVSSGMSSAEVMTLIKCEKCFNIDKLFFAFFTHVLAPCLAQRVQRVQIFPPARSSRLEKEDNICTLIKKRPLQLLQIVLLLDLPPELSFKQ